MFAFCRYGDTSPASQIIRKPAVCNLRPLLGPSRTTLFGACQKGGTSTIQQVTRAEFRFLEILSFELATSLRQRLWLRSSDAVCHFGSNNNCCNRLTFSQCRRRSRPARASPMACRTSLLCCSLSCDAFEWVSGIFSRSCFSKKLFGSANLLP